LEELGEAFEEEDKDDVRFGSGPQAAAPGHDIDGGGQIDEEECGGEGGTEEEWPAGKFAGGGGREGLVEEEDGGEDGEGLEEFGGTGNEDGEKWMAGVKEAVDEV
jgi:hypothetical protein